MSEPETFEIVGTVVSRQEKVSKGAGKTFYRLGLQEATGDPHDWTWWGEDATKVTIGDTYRWKVKREPMPDGRGKYRNIEEMLGEAVMDAPAPAGNISQFPTNGASHSDPVRASIEAQVALKAAVDFFGAATGTTTTDVTVAAQAFYDCIQTIQRPATAPETAAAPEQQAEGGETPQDDPLGLDPMSQGDFMAEMMRRGWGKETVTGLAEKAKVKTPPADGDYADFLRALERQWESQKS